MFSIFPKSFTNLFLFCFFISFYSVVLFCVEYIYISVFNPAYTASEVGIAGRLQRCVCVGG